MAGINRNRVASTSPTGSSVGSMGNGYGLPGNIIGSSSSNWHPTVVFLLALVVAEVVGYCALRYTFRSVHGG